MELLQEGAMNTPANGGARPPDVVVDTRYIYTLALALLSVLRWQPAQSYFYLLIFK
jgi:hypothetical protein